MGMVVIGSTDSHPLFKKLMWEYFIDNPLSVGLALQENTPAITLGGECASSSCWHIVQTVNHTQSGSGTQPPPLFDKGF